MVFWHFFGGNPPQKKTKNKQQQQTTQCLLLDVTRAEGPVIHHGDTPAANSVRILGK